MEHKAQECHSSKYIHGDRHLETNFLTLYIREKDSQKQSDLSSFTQRFIAELRLKFSFSKSNKNKKLRLIEVELLAPNNSATKRQGLHYNLV